MKVLIIGSGGREHALAWKAVNCRQVDTVFVAPGNAGTALEPGVQNIDIDVMDIDKLLEFAQREQIDLTIVGPEAPLVAGIVNSFNGAGLSCFGPTKEAAQLEGSKSFAKAFMLRHHIPTAAYACFTDPEVAVSHLERIDYPAVIKADGLAAGKGVIIVKSYSEGKETVEDMLTADTFGSAGSMIVIEEFLKGEEASFICMVNGIDVLPMASSQDHKSAFDGDVGPNTGGMGAYSPSPLVDKAMHDRIMEDVVMPTVTGMAAEGMPYTGFLYAGLMIGEDRVPNVVEFNCRFGDPEAQPVLSRLNSDIVQHCMAAVNGGLAKETAEWDPRPCLGVVMAASGYPGSYTKDHEISGLQNETPGTRVFHAGTRIDGGKVLTSGGRVLCVTACGETVADAQALAYQRAAGINWSGAWFRRDIGHRAVSRETRVRRPDG
ncbi:MAG: phosphoribosylamine--glycine ligase [bacterium]